MASFTAGTTFTDGVANDVTAAKLGVLVTNATPTSGFIQDRTSETVIASNDTVLIGDASDSNNLKRMTVDNLMKADMTGNINSTSGTIQTLTSSTATITGGTFSGSVNSTTGTISTFNSTTGTIPTLVATTLITTGTGTAASPAIVSTGDTNNGLFFPAADTIAVSTNGTERVRVDSSGNVGIGTTSPSQKLEVSGPTNTDIIAKVNASGTGSGFVQFGNSTVLGEIAGYSDGAIGLNHTGVAAKVLNSIRSGAVSNTLVLNAGNVGIGTTSPQSRLHSTSTSDGAQLILNGPQTVNEQTLLFRTGYHTNNSSAGFSAIGSIDTGGQGGILTLKTTAAGSGASGIPSERLRIDSSGNVGIGTASPTTRLHINGTGDLLQLSSSGNGTLYAGSDVYNPYFGTSSNHALRIVTNATERLRITSSGYFKAQGTSTYADSTGSYHELVAAVNDTAVVNIKSNATNGNQSVIISQTNNDQNATGTYFVKCLGGVTERATIRTNGGLANYSANNVNLSDQRLKKDIQNSPSYLDKICSIPVVNFKYKDQTHDDYNLGVIAQQVEAVCPELIDTDGFGETPADGIPLKAVYQTDLQYALMKCIQELKAENDSLKTRIAALEAA